MKNLIYQNNILDKKEQSNLLTYIKTTVKNLGPNFPGLQSSADLHLKNELRPFLKKIKKFIKNYSIKKCWANYTNGNYISWHNHSSKISVVYYLKNPNNLGVMLTNDGCNIFYTKGEENSIIMFDSKIIHSVPNFHLKKDRYTIALELI